jgi:hypothetical protein
MTPARLTIFRAFCVVALVAYGGVLCFYSLAPTGTPGTEIIGWLPGEDFMAHFVAYAILMALLAITVSTTGLSLPARTTLAGVLALGANGVLELASGCCPRGG